MKIYDSMNKQFHGGIPENKHLCIAEINDHHGISTHQCTKSRGYGPNGEYCKQHAKMLEEGRIFDTGVEGLNKIGKISICDHKDKSLYMDPSDNTLWVHCNECHKDTKIDTIQLIPSKFTKEQAEEAAALYRSVHHINVKFDLSHFSIKNNQEEK